MAVQPVSGLLLFGAASKTQTEESKNTRLIGPKLKMPSETDTWRNGKAGSTTVQTLIGGGQIFSKISEILGKTQQSVYLDMYNFQSPDLYPDRSSPPGTPGADIQAGLLNRLLALKKDGHSVKVVLDHHPDPDNNENYNNRTIEALRAGNVDVVTYPDFSKISHVKVLIVDNRYAIIGGMNWGNHSAANHDGAVFIEGPDVANLVRDIFAADWESSGGKVSELDVPDPFKSQKIKVLTTSSQKSVRGEDESIYEEILSQINNAQESVHAELFVLTQTEVVDSLIATHKRLKAAGKEGVKLLVDPGLYFSFANSRRGVLQCAKAGIPIRFYESDRDAEEKLHAKWAVFDRKRLLMGSANWSSAGLLSDGIPNNPVEAQDFGVTDLLINETQGATQRKRKTKGNHEVAVLIDSEKVAAPFVRQVLYDWKHKSFPILEFRDGAWKPVEPDKKAKAVATAVATPELTLAEAHALASLKGLPSQVAATF